MRLLEPAAAARLAALVVWGGEGDVVELSWDVAALQKANVNLRVYERSGHLLFIEQREEFVDEYLNFLDAADGVKTSRVFLIDPSLDAVSPSTPAVTPTAYLIHVRINVRYLRMLCSYDRNEERRIEEGKKRGTRVPPHP